MVRPYNETSTNGPRENRSAKGRDRAPADRETANAIESSSLQPVELPQQTQSPTPEQVSPTSAETGPASAKVSPGQSQGESTDRHEAIARAAYYRAEQRGFTPGNELEDWLEAERELLEKEGASGLH